MFRPRPERGFAAARFLGFVAITLVLVALGVPVAALTFSVGVKGKSMDPTLTEGDRLVMDVFGDDTIHRFDLVDSALDDNQNLRIVKRVIGLPGDKVRVIQTGETAMDVYVRPAGEQRAFRVKNPAWDATMIEKVASCCTKEGTSTSKPQWTLVPDDMYWLIGDNWGHSDDSRKFGFATRSDITAKLNFRILPLGAFGTVPNDLALVASNGRS